MVEGLIQVAALALQGNSMLAHRSEDVPEGFNRLSVFRASQFVTFERTSSRMANGTIATMPSQWLRRLCKEETHHFRFTFGSQEFSGANKIPNGDPKGYGIFTEGNAGIEIWNPEWSFRGEQQDGANWKVNYVSSRGSRMLHAGSRPLAAATESILEEIGLLAAFFEEIGHKTWRNRIHALLAFHEQGDEIPDRFADAIPRGETTKTSRVLLGDVIRSWMMLTSPEFRSLELEPDCRTQLNGKLGRLWTAMGQSAEASINLHLNARADAA